MKTDEFWMSMALDLARRGEGRTRPNPPVGAVVVKAGRLVGKGYHRRAGGAHAEVEAIGEAGKKARNATIYVTLEPCSTHGRTPPCTELIKASGITRVVMGTRDPNPKHRGRAVASLRRVGIAVEKSVCGEACKELIEPFAHWITTGRPYVSLKMAMTLDGKIADATGHSKWITGPAARRVVAEQRKRSDGVMVGCRTARLDDPGLRQGSKRTRAFRVIVDSKGSTPLNSQVLTDADVAQTVIATTKASSEKKCKAYAACGAQVWQLPMSRGHVSIPALMKRLGKLGLLRVQCEGGGELAEALIRARAVNEYLFFGAPQILGGSKATQVVGGKGWALPAARQLTFVSTERVGRDILLRAVPKGRA